METRHEVCTSAMSLLLFPGKRDGAQRTLPWKCSVAPGGLVLLSTPLSPVLLLARACCFPQRLPAFSRLFSGSLPLSPPWPGYPSRTDFHFPQVHTLHTDKPTSCHSSGPSPAPGISYLYGNGRRAIIWILPQRVGLYKLAFLG